MNHYISNETAPFFGWFHLTCNLTGQFFNGVLYFNNVFKVAYSMWHSFTGTLPMPYCLLAFNVSFFSGVIFNVVLSDAVLLCKYVYIFFK